MTFGRDLRTLLLSGMATAFSLFQVNGQDIKKSAFDKTPEPAPTALVLVSDMSDGNKGEYNEAWAYAFNRLGVYLSSRDFHVERIGSGYEYLNLKENSTADSAFSAISHNKTNDIIYTAFHGGIRKGRHTVLLGDEVTRLSDNEAMIREKDTTSVDLVRGMAKRAYEKDHPFNLIFDSCAGNQLLLDIQKSKTELPAGTTIMTFSNPEDVTFSGTVANVIRDFPSDASINNPEEFHHTYNTYIYDDTNNDKNKYTHGPSGSTLLTVGEDGSYNVLSPYKSFQDRVGIGLSQKEKNKILKNYKNFYGFKGDVYKRNKNVFRDNLNHIDTLLKNVSSFEDMPRADQQSAMRFMTHLQEKTSLNEYASFMALNHMRLESRTFLQAQKKLMQTQKPVMPVNSPR